MTSSVEHRPDKVVLSPAGYSAINTNLFDGVVNGWTEVGGNQSAIFALIGSAGISAGAVQFEQTNDPALFSAGIPLRYMVLNTLTPVYANAAVTLAASAVVLYEVALKCKYVRARISTAFVGGTARIQAFLSTMPQKVESTTPLLLGGVAAENVAPAGNPIYVAGQARTAATALTAGRIAALTLSLGGQLIQKPFSVPDADWNYAPPAGGIITNTATAVKAAAGATLRNYVTAMQVKNAHATVATEFVILDGTTVIHRCHLSANMSDSREAQFPSPLRSALNAAINVQCVTTGAQVYPNLQGFVAP